MIAIVQYNLTGQIKDLVIDRPLFGALLQYVNFLVNIKDRT
jgi:hypothetical protein